MIELRTFEGDGREASAFIRRVWSERYQTRMPVMSWTPEYFDWHLFWERPGGRDYLVAAYEGSTLVGTLLAEPFKVHLHGTPIDATMGSWLTVDNAHRRKGIANMLADEQRRRHRANGAKFMIGFGVTGADGLRFWLARPDTQPLPRLGFWIRVLDVPAVVDWSISGRDRLLARLAGSLFGRAPQAAPSPDIRAFEPDDLDACLRLTRLLDARSDLGCRWTPERLAHQLLPGRLNRTWVLGAGREPQAFVNYYLVGMTGRTQVTVAVIDVIACGVLPARERRRLLNRALAEMAAEGAAMAMAVRQPVFDGWDLVRCGFGPTPATDMRGVACVVEEGCSLANVGRLDLPWR